MIAKNTFRLLTLSLAAALALSTGCDGDKKEEDGKADKKDDGKKAEDKGDKPALMLSNDTETCRKALECCVESVKLSNDGKADPEKINLSCSGVGMAPDDDTCKQFAAGYKPAFEAASKPVPESCNL